MFSRISVLVGSILAVLAISSAGASAHPHHHHGPTRLQRLELRYEPYVGILGGDGWPVYRGRSAVPVCITNAESHGLLHEHSHPWGSSGKYQIEAATWAAEGGLKFAQLPYEATDLQQSIVASRIWDHGRGAGNWTTAAGCGY
jgi:hypothetical protein